MLPLAADSLLGFVQTYSISPQILCVSGLSDAGRPRQRYLGQVVAVETCNVGIIGDCQRILRLNNFNVVSNPRTESIARLLQSLSGKGYRAFLDSKFLLICFQIEIDVANLLFDSRSQVFQSLFLLVLAKRRPGEHLRVLSHPEKEGCGA